MSEIGVTKIFTFDSAHRLSNYNGKCSMLHGHTYKLEISIVGLVSDSGMIIDFNQIKNIYKKNIEVEFDHKTILYKMDTVNLLISKNMPSEWIKWVDYNPTAENMVQDIYKVLVKNIESMNIKISEIKLWETPTSFATIK